MRALGMLSVCGLLACGESSGLVAGGDEDVGQLVPDGADFVFTPTSGQALSTGVPLVAFLNFGGGSYRKGTNDSSGNVSTAFGGAVTSAAVPAYAGNAAQRAQVVACVREKLAAWKVSVTDQDPGAAEHTELVLGGGPELLGWPASTAGIAPLGCDVVPRAVGFAFSQGRESNTEQLCQIAAHELGHTFSLDHLRSPADLMNWRLEPGSHAFTSGSLACGETSDRACACGGTAMDPVATLNTRLGVAGSTAPPPPPPPPPAAPPCGQLAVGAVLAAGQAAHSCDGRFTFAMQGDGNLVLYLGSTALWSSRTNGSGADHAVMQGDGNLVVYTANGTAKWSSGTWGHGGAWLAVQNDGNVVVYAPGGRALWSTGTWGH
ncbi:MAG: hypothetical protein K1X89_16330 [Myxococcaceae bacterium]|nr:hypothetical protein [Myxococcaceae bacterium]